MTLNDEMSEVFKAKNKQAEFTYFTVERQCNPEYVTDVGEMAKALRQRTKTEPRQICCFCQIPLQQPKETRGGSRLTGRGRANTAGYPSHRDTDGTDRTANDQGGLPRRVSRSTTTGHASDLLSVTGG